MKIAVCIKQVPTREWQPRLNEAKTWIREQDAAFEMNEPDAYALEEALRLRETHGGEVVVCSAGPSRVQQVIREALARGADRALHVEDNALAAADAFVAADALAAAIGVTREHLSRTFAAAGAPNLKRVIDLVRLIATAELAKNPGYDIGDVARILGFASSSHLSSTAQRVVGTRPASLSRLRAVDLVERFAQGRFRSRS